MDHIPPPLCVDLDGTLVRTDLMVETLFVAIKKTPSVVPWIPIWFLRGPAYLKHRLAAVMDLPPENLPYRMDLVEFLSREKHNGRKLFLVTGSDIKIADSVARHLAIFDGVIASDGHLNMVGSRKAHALQEQFGIKGFDYVGNACCDMPVWKVARKAIAVDAQPNLQRHLQSAALSLEVFSQGSTPWSALWTALRPYQWAKNLLVLVPWITSHKFTDLNSLSRVAAAFLCFCFCASGQYLLNDLLDLPADRRHPRKRDRPIAAGHLPLLWALAFGPVLILAGVGLAYLMPIHFFVIVIGYVVLTNLYSLRLKSIPILDVIVLAGFYTLRVLAGAAAIWVPVSPWLLAFSMFFFMSLALLKRFMDLTSMSVSGVIPSSFGGYVPEDRAFLANIGAITAYMAILVFALYIDSEMVQNLYRHPHRLWWVGILLIYWVTRLWLWVHRDRLRDDPVRFALKDRQSYVVALLAGLFLWWAGPR
jgi:4-hydroxybenzoate polyprenyltransferase